MCSILLAALTSLVFVLLLQFFFVSGVDTRVLCWIFCCTCKLFCWAFWWKCILLGILRKGYILGCSKVHFCLVFWCTHFVAVWSTQCLSWWKVHFVVDDVYFLGLFSRTITGVFWQMYVWVFSRITDTHILLWLFWCVYVHVSYSLAHRSFHHVAKLTSALCGQPD